MATVLIARFKSQPGFHESDAKAGFHESDAKAPSPGHPPHLPARCFANA